MTQAEIDAMNLETSAREVKEFKANPPDRYFAYGDKGFKNVTTWIGDKLGDIISFGRVYTNNFGGRVRHCRIRGVNGRTYLGTENYDCGYVRMRLAKGK